jgi:hypothetical protein
VTRLLVRAPVDAERFNGTVVVEWFNVAGAQDAGVEWIYAHTELLRSGAAWVGVSAQTAGITGLPNPLGGGRGPHCLKLRDPERYAPLRHPGDDYSYDIFSQAGRTVRTDAARLVGGEVETLIAVGVSMSAYRLTTYVNAVDPLARVFDGFLVHARPGYAAPLTLPANPADIDTSPVRFRPDLRVPVLVVQTETDVITLGSWRARQSDAEHLRVWEIAGAAHADTYLRLGSTADDGALPPDRLAAAFCPAEQPGRHVLDCGPQHHYVANAAVARLARWAGGAGPPPHAPRLTVHGDRPPRLVRDRYGNALGGVRTPWLDVPLTELSGLGPPGNPIARLFGTARPLPPATLRMLYPTPAAYLTAFQDAATAACRAGFLLEADLPEILDTAPALLARHLASKAADKPGP